MDYVLQNPCPPTCSNALLRYSAPLVAEYILCRLTHMRIFLFGNPDLQMDALPIRVLPQLQKRFPSIQFEVLDPNEEWDVPKHMVIIDTVLGITSVTIFHSLDMFLQTPRVTCHDFDAYTNLLFLKKLGTIDRTTILGVPPSMNPFEAETALSKAIDSFVE